MATVTAGPAVTIGWAVPLTEPSVPVTVHVPQVVAVHELPVRDRVPEIRVGPGEPAGGV
jgi:hypothetical protein